MSVEPAPSGLTVEQFVAWAAQQPGRYELIDGEVVAMASEGGRHNRVKGRIFRLLEDAVDVAGLACTVFTDGMLVKIDASRGREPDAIVTASALADPDSAVAVDPLIIVEVVSPSSESRDTEDKLLDYFSVPSIQHYLVVLPLRRAVIHHARGPDGALLTRIIHNGDIKLDPPGLTIAVAAILAVAG